MHRGARIVASALAVGALGVAGVQSGATASQLTDTCTHTVKVPSSSHPNGVEFLTSFAIGEQHWHRYRHHTATEIGNHNRDRNCTGHIA
jgi:hypothetical protein